MNYKTVLTMTPYIFAILFNRAGETFTRAAFISLIYVANLSGPHSGQATNTGGGSEYCLIVFFHFLLFYLIRLVLLQFSSLRTAEIRRQSALDGYLYQ